MSVERHVLAQTRVPAQQLLDRVTTSINESFRDLSNQELQGTADRSASQVPSSKREEMDELLRYGWILDSLPDQRSLAHVERLTRLLSST